jgi:hypothetical protein
MIEEILPRTQQNMQTAINSGLLKEYSIHEQNNAFWNLPYVFLINVFNDNNNSLLIFIHFIHFI